MTTQRSFSRKLLVTLFALLALNSTVDAIQHVVDPDDVLLSLFGLEVVAAALAVTAAVGLWRRARWAPIAIGAWGLETAAMIMLLGGILDLDPKARGGLWTGAVVILTVAALCVWYAKRTGRAGAVSRSRA